MQQALDVPVEVPVHHVSAFDFDDAFRDDDDNDLSYQFSPDSIREDMSKILPTIDQSWQDDDENAPGPSGFFEAQNTSVSTLDIDHASLAAYSRSISPATVPEDDSELASHFSQISLSPTDHHDDEYDSSEHQQNALQSHRLNVTDPKHKGDYDAEHPYPNVIIDASKPPSKRISVISTHSVSDEVPPSNASSVPAALEGAPTTSASSRASEIPPLTVQSPSIINKPITSSSGPSLLEVKAGPKVSGHRPTRSVGPSAFEKVRSKTRPSFLPPKPRQEDDKHMADWQHMMKLSRTAAEKRRRALQERRLAREKAIEDSLHIWEKEIVPDWRVIHKNPALRKLWWHGIPAKLRATMWEKAVGNELALSKDHYRTCLARAKRALASGIFPRETLDLIEEDVSTTLPAIHIFHKETGPLYDDLKDMLYAWVVSRSDEGLGYTIGAAKIAAMVLLNMPSQQGFIVMRNLLERHLMRSFFGGERSKDDVEAYYRIFDTLLADGMPKIYFNFKQHQISPAAYLPDWLIPLFLNHLPFEACARVWDVLLLEGDSFLYRACLGILAVLEPRLFFPDRKELLELLKCGLALHFYVLYAD
ncbi:rab-GTPase-TBC domain-containing protein [Crucibulum laeve]|uniref:Rab-GTPase-TBC domain-containing protein n=1 Tax=Crucibulum laeve TaxID=68775 RepID=A0A5C3LW99_9AGAR|nr:rab-GTPase-TBC domain-containing protein [Crucibulum laeve]